MSDTEIDKKENIDQKKEYIKPEIKSEDLVSFGALCNGTEIGGRKAAVPVCNTRKINS